MTNIIIPMAGEGKRFSEKGYSTGKPSIPTYDRRTGKLIPMVVCAVKDLPFVNSDGSNIFFLDRDFHKKDGVENRINEFYPNAKFITINKLTEGQACTCLLSEEHIDTSAPLIIAACDSGMIYNEQKFNEITCSSDVIAFTFKNDERVLYNPNAYGWLASDYDNSVKRVSVKKAISDTPMHDHAITATFWFKKAEMFFSAAKKMISLNDRVNNEFYVDNVLKYTVEMGYITRVFNVDKYLGWGTPDEYENYQRTIEYWGSFVNSKFFLGDN